MLASKSDSSRVIVHLDLDCFYVSFQFKESHSMDPELPVLAVPRCSSVLNVLNRICTLHQYFVLLSVMCTITCEIDSSIRWGFIHYDLFTHVYMIHLIGTST
jgi:hypothetical protein